MYKNLEFQHRQNIKDLQMAHEKEKQELIKETVKEPVRRKSSQQFSALARKPFSEIDRFCSIVLSEGLKVRTFSYFRTNLI